jgi:GNAT superfamily N-acetyltransferase
METVRIEFEPFLGEEARQFIMGGVDNYNIAATGLSGYFPVNFVLRGERGDVLGGLLGQLWGGWLQLTYLWISEAARGSGHGTRLMNEAEAYARSRGAIAGLRRGSPRSLRKRRLVGPAAAISSCFS